jgi:hypothetical protein
VGISQRAGDIGVIKILVREMARKGMCNLQVSIADTILDDSGTCHSRTVLKKSGPCGTK